MACRFPDFVALQSLFVFEPRGDAEPGEGRRARLESGAGLCWRGGRQLVGDERRAS